MAGHCLTLGLNTNFASAISAELLEHLRVDFASVVPHLCFLKSAVSGTDHRIHTTKKTPDSLSFGVRGSAKFALLIYPIHLRPRRKLLKRSFRSRRGWENGVISTCARPWSIVQRCSEVRKLEGVLTSLVCRFEPCLPVSRMASSSASGSELDELKKMREGFLKQKDAEMKKQSGTRDGELLGELNKDLDRVQAAITALSSGEL